jgi:hypothetical protein
MKNLIFVFACLLSFSVFGQEIITNQAGEKIILNSDKTWGYFEVKKVINDSTNRSGSLSHINLSDSSTISKFLNTQSIDVVKEFDINDFEVLDYCCGHSPSFLIKDVNGKTGFVSSNTRSRDNELIRLLDKTNDLNTLEKQSPINIIGTKIEEINTAGGVDFSITWQYLDKSKDIKYLDFTVVPYNCVGDLVTGEYDNGRFKGEITGPISASEVEFSPGKFKRENSYWSRAWYNSTICSIKIVKVEVEYMDGTKYIYVKELPKISSPYLKYFSF